jgi:hypothetical protein
MDVQLVAQEASFGTCSYCIWILCRNIYYFPPLLRVSKSFSFFFQVFVSVLPKDVSYLIGLSKDICLG